MLPRPYWLPQYFDLYLLPFYMNMLLLCYIQSKSLVKVSTIVSLATYVFYLSFSEGYSDKECHKGIHLAYTIKHGCKSHIDSNTSRMIKCTLEILRSCRKANRGIRASKETPFICEALLTGVSSHTISPQKHTKRYGWNPKWRLWSDREMSDQYFWVELEEISTKPSTGVWTFQPHCQACMYVRHNTIVLWERLLVLYINLAEIDGI